MRMELSIWGYIEAERTTEPPGSVWVRGLELQGRSGQEMEVGIITGVVGFSDRD